MEKRKWPWKRKSSESESSESFSSHSERYSDEQLLEVTSKAAITGDEMKESVKSLTEKLSAALVNVCAKEDLVKQHAKVAEEAVAGWEKAENEVGSLKQQLEVALQQNLNLEVKTSHLDSALKECVRQLRQARDEQEKRISDALVEKNSEWKLMKAELEKHVLDLQAEKTAPTGSNTLLILEAVEKENLSLKEELVSRCKELKVVAIERDLSTQAAETASKLQLESIKKVAKLEAECKRLESIVRRLNSVENNSCKTSIREDNGPEPGCLGSWDLNLASGDDQFRKPSAKNLAVEIDMMDDFLEMERLVALPESACTESISVDNPLRAELDSMIERVADLENILENIETEKLELQIALDETVDSFKKAESRIAEDETRLEELQKELTAVNEAKELFKLQLISMEEESRMVSATVDSLKAEIETERILSAELRIKCQELENELTRTIQETELQQTVNSNSELKIKQEDLAVAADKLAECQKTIASLGRQLQSLATLEDFLIDTSSIPGFSRDSLDSGNGEVWRLSSNETFVPNCDSGHSRISMENHNYIANGNGDASRTLSLSPSSANNGTTARSRNSFGKLFC